MIPRNTEENEILSRTPSRAEDLSSLVAEQQQVRMDLQRRLEAIQEQQRLLQEMAEKQQRIKFGKKEVTDLLRRALQRLGQDEDSARRQMEQIAQVRVEFVESLKALEEIAPESLKAEEMELNHALGQIERAESVYQQGMQILQMEDGSTGTAFSSTSTSDVPADDFGLLVRKGFALHLPLLILGIAFFIAYLLKK